MKLLILIFLTVVSVPGYSQNSLELRSKPEKGDAHIVVNSEATILQVAQHLMDNGYEVEKMDTILNVITSSPRPVPGINGEYYLNIMKKGKQYKVVGMTRLNFTATLAGISPVKPAFEPARFTKSKGSDRRVFDAAFAFAESFGVVVDLMK